jgi:hypothetical protein
MTRDAILRDGGDLSSGGWINYPERLVSLIGDQEQTTSDFAPRLHGIQSGP